MSIWRINEIIKLRYMRNFTTNIIVQFKRVLPVHVVNVNIDEYAVLESRVVIM